MMSSLRVSPQKKSLKLVQTKELSTNKEEIIREI